MTKFTARIAGIASLALVTFGAAANAQPSVRVADLNLASAAGKAAFDHRMNVAADQVCGDEKGLTIQYACKAGVRAEVAEKLTMITPATQFAAAPTSSTRVRPSVRVADLNLASAAGKAAFAHRMNVAANQACSDERDLTIQHACKIGVRAEVTEKLAMTTSVTQLAVR